MLSKFCGRRRLNLQAIHNLLARRRQLDEFDTIGRPAVFPSEPPSEAPPIQRTSCTQPRFLEHVEYVVVETRAPCFCCDILDAERVCLEDSAQYLKYPCCLFSFRVIDHQLEQPCCRVTSPQPQKRQTTPLPPLHKGIERLHPVWSRPASKHPCLNNCEGA